MSSTSVANPKIENFGGTETYTVTVTETTSGCAVTANATVTLSTTPLVLVGITNSNPSYCSGDSSILVVSATGGCQPYTYAWSGGAGSTASVKVKSTVNTTYSVTVTDKGGSTVTASTSVNVIAPQITATSVVGGNGATATTTTICGPSAVDLSATPSAGATIKWYDALTGGNLLATGNNYTTPAVVSATKNYYAQASITSGTSMNVARAVPAATSADYWTNYGLVFNTTSDIVLNSVVVYPSNSAPANMTIRLINSAGTQVSGTSDVTFMPISASGATPQTVNLGYSIPAGNNYKLIIVSGMSSSNELVQESSGYSYPITNGPV